MITIITQHLKMLSDELERHDPLPFAGPEILTFEFLLYTLRQKAPMEFDEYLQVLLSEVKTGRRQDEERINHVRNQLSDTIELNTFT